MSLEAVPVLGYNAATCQLCGTTFAKQAEKQKHCDVCRELPGDVWETVNRIRKATKLAGVLKNYKVSAEAAIRLPNGVWELVAAQAGCNAPSRETQAIVAYLLNANV